MINVQYKHNCITDIKSFKNLITQKGMFSEETLNQVNNCEVCKIMFISLQKNYKPIKTNKPKKEPKVDY